MTTNNYAMDEQLSRVLRGNNAVIVDGAPALKEAINLISTARGQVICKRHCERTFGSACDILFSVFCYLDGQRLGLTRQATFSVNSYLNGNHES